MLGIHFKHSVRTTYSEKYVGSPKSAYNKASPDNMMCSAVEAKDVLG